MKEIRNFFGLLENIGMLAYSLELPRRCDSNEHVSKPASALPYCVCVYSSFLPSFVVSFHSAIYTGWKWDCNKCNIISHLIIMKMPILMSDYETLIVQYKEGAFFLGGGGGGVWALSRIFYLYRAYCSSKVRENRRTRRKTTWPSVSRPWLSHIWPERGSNHSGKKPNGLRVNSLIH